MQPSICLAKVTRLHERIERLCNIKEMRTPVLLRCFVRWYTMIIFPVFLGFYGQNLSHTTRLPGMLGILIIWVRLAIFTEASHITLNIPDYNEIR